MRLTPTEHHPAVAFKLSPFTNYRYYYLRPSHPCHPRSPAHAHWPCPGRVPNLATEALPTQGTLDTLDAALDSGRQNNDGGCGAERPTPV